jgi:RNA polymerase sigma factor for flagellar operon FliA
MKLEDAGKKLGLSKSWASRLHSRAVNRLREALEEGES